jgi:hypothetical protein
MMLIPLFYLLHFFGFVAPGLGLGHLCLRRVRLPPELTVPAGIIGSCLLGYAVFWAYFASPTLGRVAALIALGASLLLLLPAGGPEGSALAAEVRTPLLLMALVGLFFVLADRAVALPDEDSEDHIRFRFADRLLFVDCDLPFYFAESLHDGDDPRALFGDWRSSDRPPLQTGLFLMQSWLRGWGPEPWCSYHLLGCVAQSTWVPAVWGLCRLLRLPRRRCGMVVLLVAFNGFTLVNTVYCWPKMLAGALALFALAALVLGSRSASRWPSVLAGAAAALALLAHGGAIFTLLAVALFALTPSLFPGWRSGLGGVAVAAALLAPWLVYQKWYDPPGNRLLKWHLAGVIDIDERTVGQTLFDAYRGTPSTELFKKRIVNSEWLFLETERDPGYPANFGSDLRPEGAASLLVRFRDAQLRHLFPALGLLNLGWFVFLWRLGRRGAAQDRADRFLLGVGLTGVLIWLLLLFRAGGAMLHHASYADVLLLMTGLAALLCRRDAVPAYLLLAAQTLVFLLAWLFTTPTLTPGVPNGSLVSAAAVCFVLLLGVALDAWDLRLLRWLRRKVRCGAGRGLLE